MLNLKQAASDAVNGSKIMANRTKIEQRELEDKTIHVDGFDIIQVESKLSKKLEKVPVITCKEYPQNYFFGGKAFSDIAEAWLQAAEGDIDNINASLQESPVKVSLKATTTRNGNKFTRVVVED